jgi:hypothetical protein
VRLLHDYSGRGPTRARTTIGDDVIVCVLADTLTKSEWKLVQGGEERLVLDQRSTFHERSNSPPTSPSSGSGAPEQAWACPTARAVVVSSRASALWFLSSWPCSQDASQGPTAAESALGADEARSQGERHSLWGQQLQARRQFSRLRIAGWRRAHDGHLGSPAVLERPLADRIPRGRRHRACRGPQPVSAPSTLKRERGPASFEREACADERRERAVQRVRSVARGVSWVCSRGWPSESRPPWQAGSGGLTRCRD